MSAPDERIARIVRGLKPTKEDLSMGKKKRLELDRTRADPRHAKMILLIEQCVDERIENLIAARKKKGRKKDDVDDEGDDDEDDDDDPELGDDDYWVL